jgi:ubiquinone/menaquinone biosynthesis C-methylase UbiE
MNAPSSRSSDQYIHGSAPDEQRRLSRLNDLLNEASLRELGLRGGEVVLDIGSGIAQFTRAIARAAGPAGKVIGVERDAAQLEEARRQAASAGESSLVELRQGDALNLPVQDSEWGTFDVVHARFLLEHVADPLAVVQSMARAVRPGGRVVLADDDHDVLRLWPEPPGLNSVWQAYIRSYDRLGHDPYVGRRLVALLHAAGILPRRNNWVFFGSCAGSPAFADIADNLVRILVGASDVIVSTAHLSKPQFDDAITALNHWSTRPDAAFWFAMCWAEGTRPEPPEARRSTGPTRPSSSAACPD